MKKLTFSILLILLFIGIIIIPINAETFSKTYSNLDYSHWQCEFSPQNYFGDGTPIYIYFYNNWENYNGIYYIAGSLDSSVGYITGSEDYVQTTMTLTYDGTTYGRGDFFAVKQYNPDTYAYEGVKFWIQLDEFDTNLLQSNNIPSGTFLYMDIDGYTLWSAQRYNGPSVGPASGDSSLGFRFVTSDGKVPCAHTAIIAKESEYTLSLTSDYKAERVNYITIDSADRFITVKGLYEDDIIAFTSHASGTRTYPYLGVPLNVTSYLPDGQIVSDIIGEGVTSTTSINVDIDKGSIKQSEDEYSIIKTSSASYNYPEDIIVETTNIPEESISTIGYYLFSDESGIIKDGYTYYLLANDSYRKQKYDIDTSQYLTVDMVNSVDISSEISSITFDMENLDSGHYEVRARFTGYPTTYISGIGYAGEVASTYDITLHIRDAITQSGISGEYILSEYNPETDILEEIGSGNFAGSTTWNLKPETQYSWDFESTGYRNREFNLLATGDVQRVIYMYPEGSNYTLGFSIYETISGQETGVYGAKIDINGQIIYSNSVGSAGIGLPAGNYSYTVSAEGYTSQTGSVYLEEDIFVSVKLSPTGGEITPTPTPTPFNIDKPTNIIESVKYAFAKMFGFDGTNPEKINLLFALIIITGTASLAGTITRRGEEVISGTGVLIGAGIGFIFSIALDLIPLWILFIGIAGIVGYILFIRTKEE